MLDCCTASVQQRNVDMKQIEKIVSRENKLHFLQDYLALDDGSTALVPLLPPLAMTSTAMTWIGISR
jgi:hypothetical protein